MPLLISGLADWKQTFGAFSKPEILKIFAREYS
jgi:hypothetical protein